MIINADDFGYSTDVNAAIIEAFQTGLCSSTTLMVNMPGASEAGSLAREHKLTGFVGMHLVLDEGDPLTDTIRRQPLFCSNVGHLCLPRSSPIFRLSTSEQSALADEIRAQIAQCRSLGIDPTHIDSHHHIHTEWAIGKVLLRVAREQGIVAVRPTRNCGASINTVKRVYKWAYNQRLRQAGLKKVKYFGSIDDIVDLMEHERGNKVARSCEIMVHPLFDRERVLTDNGTIPLDSSLRRIEQINEAVSYIGHRYG